MQRYGNFGDFPSLSGCGNSLAAAAQNLARGVSRGLDGQCKVVYPQSDFAIRRSSSAVDQQIEILVVVSCAEESLRWRVTPQKESLSIIPLAPVAINAYRVVRGIYAVVEVEDAKLNPLLACIAPIKRWLSMGSSDPQ